MNVSTIRAAARSATKKGPNRKLRADGKVPAIVYGGAGEPALIEFDPSELATLRRGPLGWNQPITIEVDGGERVAAAMLREVQRHPVSGKMLHADFVRIVDGEDVLIDVPVQVVGKAAGEEAGGRVDLIQYSVRLACRPEAIPRSVPVDVTPLQIGDRVMVDKLVSPEGTRVVFQSNFPVVGVSGKKGAEEKAAAPTATPAAAPAAAKKAPEKKK